MESMREVKRLMKKELLLQGNVRLTFCNGNIKLVSFKESVKYSLGNLYIIDKMI